VLPLSRSPNECIVLNLVGSSPPNGQRSAQPTTHTCVDHFPPPSQQSTRSCPLTKEVDISYMIESPPYSNIHRPQSTVGCLALTKGGYPYLAFDQFSEYIDSNSDCNRPREYGQGHCRRPSSRGWPRCVLY
jgi:hypothetical protein